MVFPPNHNPPSPLPWVTPTICLHVLFVFVLHVLLWSIIQDLILYYNRTDSDALFSTNRSCLFNKNNLIKNDTELTNSKHASLSPALRAVVEQV